MKKPEDMTVEEMIAEYIRMGKVQDNARKRLSRDEARKVSEAAHQRRIAINDVAMNWVCPLRIGQSKDVWKALWAKHSQYKDAINADDMRRIWALGEEARKDQEEFEAEHPEYAGPGGFIRYLEDTTGIKCE
jgi:hypothetical protein